MIALLVALRDIVIAVLVGWLGISTDSGQKEQQQAEPAHPIETQVSMFG